MYIYIYQIICNVRYCMMVALYFSCFFHYCCVYIMFVPSIHQHF